MEINDLRTKCGFVGSDEELSDVKDLLDCNLGDLKKIHNLDFLYNFCFKKNCTSTKKYLYFCKLRENSKSFKENFEDWYYGCFGLGLVLFAIPMLYFKSIALIIWGIMALVLPIVTKIIHILKSKRESIKLYNLKKADIEHAIGMDKEIEKTNEQSIEEDKRKQVDPFIKEILDVIESMKENRYPGDIEDAKLLKSLAEEYMQYQMNQIGSMDINRTLNLSLDNTDFYTRLVEIESRIRIHQKQSNYLKENQDILDSEWNELRIPTLEEELSPSLKLSKEMKKQ